MRRGGEKQRADLIIQVRFEVSHVAAECLAEAYNRVVPRRRRTLTVMEPGTCSQALAPERRSGRSRAC